MFSALLFMGFILETASRPPTIVVMLVLASLTGIGIFFMTNPFSVTTFELIMKILLMCTVNAVTLVVVEGYPCHLR